MFLGKKHTLFTILWTDETPSETIPPYDSRS